MQITLSTGLPSDQRDAAAQLYYQAFRAKLHKVMAPDDKAVAFIAGVLDSSHMISAVDSSGTLMGIAGFKTHSGAMVGGGLKDLQAIYGTWGGLWRGGLLGLLERDLEPDILLMDGICVAEEARGHGIGSRLLTAIKQEASNRGCAKVRLDVIDSNPRAKALYERQGFEPKQTQDIGPLRHLFGFSRALRMEYAVTQQSDACRDAAN